MNIKVDLHTHTIASTHAYSTILENVSYAKKAGLEGIAITDHGLSTPDCPHRWHFGNLKIFPDYVEGIRVFKGAECSYVDEDANLDLPEGILSGLDVVIGSMHLGGLLPDFEKKEQYINLILKATENPFIDILGHISRTKFKLEKTDCEKIAMAAKKNKKLVELNNECLNKSLLFKENACVLMKVCKENSVPIVVNTDAHFALLVGNTEAAKALLEEINFDENLIVNRNLDVFNEYLKTKLHPKGR